MKLCDIDEAAALRNHRVKAMRLVSVARSGIIDLRLQYGGDEYDAFSVISADSIRRAIADACNAFIREIEAKLEKFGIVIPEDERAE